MFKHKNYLALGAVVLAVVLVFSLPPHATGRLKLALGSLFLPLLGLAGTAQQFPVAAADAALTRRELLQQFEKIRRENDQLKVLDLQSAAIAQENGQLRAALGWQRRAPWKLKLANVVLRDPANWWRSVEIDLGTRDGVAENLAVLTSEGLVGRVSSAGPTRSRVVLLGDPNCKASALVENSSHDLGILGASDPLDDSMVELTYLSRNASLKPGQSVVTSGLGGIFPKGIPVGQIVDSRSVEYGLYTEARVKLNANLGALEEVWVLMP